MQDHKHEQDGSQYAHGAAVPGTPPVSHWHFVTFGTFAVVLRGKNVALDKMQEDACEQTHFQNSDKYRAPHKMRSLIKHSPVVGCVKQVCENAGINTYVNN